MIPILSASYPIWPPLTEERPGYQVTVIKSKFNADIPTSAAYGMLLPVVVVLLW